MKRTKGTRIKTIATVHDEILLEMDERKAQQAAYMLKDIMESRLIK